MLKLLLPFVFLVLVGREVGDWLRKLFDHVPFLVERAGLIAEHFLQHIVNIGAYRLVLLYLRD